MMKRKFFMIMTVLALLTSCTSCEAKENENEEVNNPQLNDLGAMTPSKALEYMKTTKNLVIVDVAAKRWYDQQHFEGAVNIPIENISSDEAKALYLDLPAGRPIMLHCRQGAIVPGAYRTLKSLRSDIPEISYIAGVPPFDAYNEWYQEQNSGEEEKPPVQNDLGAVTPEKALEYMKTTQNLVIVDVASVTNYNRQHFEGAVNVPIENISGTDADKLYRELPQGRPVILHCRRGAIVPGAYRRVKELRPDIPEISYIAGVPPFDAYNQWYNNNK